MENIKMLDSLRKAPAVPNDLENQVFMCIGVTIIAQENLDKMAQSETFNQPHYDALTKALTFAQQACEIISNDLQKYVIHGYHYVETEEISVSHLLSARDGMLFDSMNVFLTLAAILPLNEDLIGNAQVFYYVVDFWWRHGLNVDIKEIIRDKLRVHGLSEQNALQISKNVRKHKYQIQVEVLQQMVARMNTVNQ